MEKEDPIFTSEGMEMFVEIKSVTANLDVPATFKLHDLEQEAVHKKLVAELQKDAPSAWSCRCGTAPRPSNGCRPSSRRTTSTCHRRHRRRSGCITRPQLHTNYVLYTEDLTAEELAQVLQQLGVEDKKDAEKKPGRRTRSTAWWSAA